MVSTGRLLCKKTVVGPKVDFGDLVTAQQSIADNLGSTKVANVVLMGALLEETECLGVETALEVLQSRVKKTELLEINRKALEAGGAGAL